MQLKLRQVFYKEDQPLDGGCIPYSAVDYEPRYYENQHILDLYEKGDHLDCDYWGLTSFRMYEKTELNYVDIASYITSNPGKDAYLYLNHGDAQNLLQNEDFPIGKVIGRFPLIGREIRLADILLAISSSKGDEAWEYAIDSLGRFMRDWGESRHEALSRHWDIRNDSLDSQSEDTISFIHSLLFDNKDNI